MQHMAHPALNADAVPERLPSREAQKRARLRACGRVRVQLSGLDGPGREDRRAIRGRS